MCEQNHVMLAVKSWAAWAPGIASEADWREWADGQRKIDGPANPDVKFVEPLMRRKLSPLTRMAFRVATDCMHDHPPASAHIFCSRYGEYGRTFDILSALADDEPLSAMAFSMSVHNTSSSLFSINQQDIAISTALAAGSATLETAFVESWSMLEVGDASSVLVVYHDLPLPEIYQPQSGSVDNPIALAMLVSLPDASSSEARLALSWGSASDLAAHQSSPMAAALNLVRMLLEKGDVVTVGSGRLVWKWRRFAEKN